jgi:SpoIID/LytB domain protein
MLRSRARSLAALALVAGPLLVGAAPASPTVFVLEGRGHGHGVGMAQDSAQAMAVEGKDHEQILGHFYPGTARGRRSSLIRVVVWEAGSATGQVAVTVPGGARVSSDTGAVQARAGAVLQVAVDASGYHVREATPPRQGSVLRAALLEPSPSPTGGGPLPNLLPSRPPGPSAAPSPSPTRPPASSGPAPRSTPSPASTRAPAASASPAEAPLSFDSRSPVTITPAGTSVSAVAPTGRRYRGQLTAIAREGFRLVNVLDVEDYLRGMGEVPAGWPQAALRAQAVAARTYALRAVAAGHPLGYDVCDDTRCQVYLGVQAEAPSTAAAARATRGEVITYGGNLADTFYSANAGGVTATPGEGFGSSTTIPYLPGGVAAPGGVAPWRLAASPQDVAARLGYPGRLDALAIVGKGPSGRVTRLRLDGAAGSRELTGVEVARRLGLRSTLFTVSRSSGTAQALPAAELTQLPPAQAAEAVVQLEPSVAPSPSLPAEVRAAAAGTRGSAPDLATTVAAMLVVLAGFGAVLGRRRMLTRKH